jgi:endonuclease YncB( thermonuclease family)
MKPALALVLILAAFPAVAQDCTATQGLLPEKWEGVAFAIDGSTLAGVGLKPHIQLWGVQTPELRDKDQQETIAGMRSRAALEDMLLAGERRVTCQATRYDRACRILAQCTITAEFPRGSKPAPQDLALRLLEDGLGYGVGLNETLPWDKTANERYGHYEGLARQARKGLWPTWLGKE